MLQSRTLKITGDEFNKPLVRIEDLEFAELTRPITLINGSFDLLHSGHMYLFHQARNCNLNGTIVVALDSDELVGSKKGKFSILTFLERWRSISYMPVDLVVEIKSDSDFITLAGGLHPDYRVRGEDYKGKSSRIKDIPTIWVPRVDKMSSTEIKKRLRNG